MRFRTTWRATARRNERLRRSTFAGLRMARVLETVSRPCFNPLPPTLGGRIGNWGTPPKPSAASCCTPSVIPAELVLVKTGSGNPGVDVGRAKRSETRRHCLPSNPPAPTPSVPPLAKAYPGEILSGIPSDSRREASLPLTPASLQGQDGHAQESGRESAQCHDVYPDVTDPPAP